MFKITIKKEGLPVHFGKLDHPKPTKEVILTLLAAGWKLQSIKLEGQCLDIITAYRFDIGYSKWYDLAQTGDLPDRVGGITMLEVENL